MIQSYRDKRTRDFAEGKRVGEFEGFRRQAEKRLDILWTPRPASRIFRH